MKQSSARLRDRRRRDEKLPLGLPFDNQKAIEPDVVDEHAVGKVAARVGATQFDSTGKPSRRLRSGLVWSGHHSAGSTLITAGTEA